MGKLIKCAKVAATIFSIGVILITASSPEYSADAKFVCAVLCSLILCFVYIPTFRNLCLTVFFLICSISGISLTHDNGNFVWAGAALELCFVCGFFHFFHKVFGNIRWNRANRVSMADVDRMTGLEFERYTAELLSQLGFYRIDITKASGDQGVDVIAHKGGSSYAIQCKHYSGSLGNSSVQEAYAGKAYYGCDYAAVITNSHFTSGAKELAESTGVLLWDRSTLQSMIYEARRPRWFHQPKKSAVKHDGSAGAQIVDDSQEEDPIQKASLSQPEFPSAPVLTPTPKHGSLDPSFIAEAQWYAARGGSDLIEDE